MIKKYKFFILLFVLLSAIFLIRYRSVGQAVYGDGISYWMYTRSIGHDMDLDLSNELGHSYSPESNNIVEYKENYLDTGIRPARYFPIGPSLMWLPGYAYADAVSLSLYLAGFQVPTNGFSDLYQITVGLQNILFVTIGIFFIYKLLLIFYKKNTSVLTLITLTCATNLIYYSSIDVLNSHPSGLFISSIFFFYYFNNFLNRRNSNYLFLGLLAGLAGIIRIQDIILIVPLIFEVLINFYIKYCKSKLSYQLIKSYGAKLLLIFIGLMIGFLPQILISKLSYGTYFHVPYQSGSEQILKLNAYHTLGIFTNTKTGLLYYSPILILGFLGLILLYKKNKYISLICLITLTTTLLIIGSWSGWDQGESYGIRMLITYYPILAIGLAYSIQLLKDKLNSKILYFIIIAFIIHNLLMIGIFHALLHNNTIINGEVSSGGKLRNEIYLKIYETKEKFSY